MRFYEFGKHRLPINLEENLMLLKIKKSDSGYIDKSNLTEREIELVRLMVSKGLLERFLKNNKIYYKIQK
jgi:hypothetical protein